MDISTGILLGFGVVLVVTFLSGFYTVDQTERAVKTTFGKAHRKAGLTTLNSPLAEHLKDVEKNRYVYPQVEVIPPGGPYFKWPWEKIHKVVVATEIVNMAYDPDTPSANANGTVLEAVTKDQLNTGMKGELRFRVSEQNLYAYLFGVKRPISHVMGYFVSILRERIAIFEASKKTVIAENSDEAVKYEIADGASINHLRKNLRELNDQMVEECLSSAARYGIVLEASLITSIDPPNEVESALAAINTAHNQVSSDISVARAAADQKVVQSKKVVEIETLKVQAEAEPLVALGAQLRELKVAGGDVLSLYLKNVRMDLLPEAYRIIRETKA